MPTHAHTTPQPTAKLQQLTDAAMVSLTMAFEHLQTVIADAANRPKEALQAAKLLVQKLNPKVWFGLGAKPSAAPAAPTQQSDAEVLGELLELEKQLNRALGLGDGGPKRKKVGIHHRNPLEKLQ